MGLLSLDIWLFQRRQPVEDGEPDKTREIADAQLLHDAAAVGLNRLRRKREPAGNLCARSALDDELKDFPLAWPQARQGTAPFREFALAHIVVNHFVRDSMAQIAMTGVDSADGVNYLNAG